MFNRGQWTVIDSTENGGKDLGKLLSIQITQSQRSRDVYKIPQLLSANLIFNQSPDGKFGIHSSATSAAFLAHVDETWQS